MRSAPRCRIDTLSLRVVTPGEPTLQQLLVTQATSLNLAEEAFGNVFYAHDPLAWVLRSSELPDVRPCLHSSDRPVVNL